MPREKEVIARKRGDDKKMQGCEIEGSSSRDSLPFSRPDISRFLSRLIRPNISQFKDCKNIWRLQCTMRNWYQPGPQLHVNPPNLGSQTLRLQRGAAPFTFGGEIGRIRKL